MGEYTASVLWGSPSNSLSFLSSSEGTIEGLQRAKTYGETHVDTLPSHIIFSTYYAPSPKRKTQ